MAKNTIADLDTTASNNTDVLNQSTQGTAAVSTIDTMIQNSLALLARFYADLGGLGTVGGTADAITLTTASTYQTLENGITLSFKAGSAITGASTINVDGLGVKAIRRIGDSATQAGDIVANGVYLLRYDTAYNSAAGAWILLNAAGATAATTSAAGIVELATDAEARTATDTARVITASNRMIGTGTNDDAAAGQIGEFVSAAIGYGSRITLVSSTSANITSVSLTAGDWDVQGSAQYEGTTSPATSYIQTSISQVSATLDNTEGRYAYGPNITTAGTNVSGVVPGARISLASTTTIYLVANAGINAGTIRAWGGISARRVR